MSRPMLTRPKLTVNVPKSMIDGSSHIYYDAKCKMFKRDSSRPERRAVLTNGHWMLWSEPPTKSHSLFHHPNRLASILQAALRKASDAAFTDKGRMTIKHSWRYDGYMGRLDMERGVPDLAVVLPRSGDYVFMNDDRVTLRMIHGSRPHRVRLTADEYKKGILTWNRETGEIVEDRDKEMSVPDVSLDLFYWLALRMIGMRFAVRVGESAEDNSSERDAKYDPIMIIRPPATRDHGLVTCGIVMPIRDAD